MQEVRKLAKTQQWFLEIVKKAPGKVKEKSEKELDENKISKDYFSQVLMSLLRSWTTSQNKPASLRPAASRNISCSRSSTRARKPNTL